VRSTIFTLTNTGALAQAARVTLWTDHAYPVITFNIYLTGYDVQKISLFDIIKRGIIAPDVEMGSGTSPRGELSDGDNPRLNEQSCSELPGQLPQVFIERMQSAFTTGRVPDLGSLEGCNAAGGTHQNAVGYATIDVVGACTATLPTQPEYFTHEIRFDNVLIGDYIQVFGDSEFAQANPLVHIRAIPEGGTAATRKKTNLPRTFYSHLQTNATKGIDGRQPLPSTFAARWIEGGQGGFATFFKIWRESSANGKTACTDIQKTAAMSYVEVIRFDEEENPESSAGEVVTIPLPPPTLPPSAMISSQGEVIPINSFGAVAGWVYFNLHNGEDANAASQNWVTVSMRAENRFSTDFDAVALGNGCTPVTAPTNAAEKPGALPIGPAPNVNP
jgi:hypothetical protein